MLHNKHFTNMTKVKQDLGVRSPVAPFMLF